MPKDFVHTLLETHEALFYLAALVCALGLGLFVMPQIIYIANRKRLFDLPDNERKLHEGRTVSNLGGIGIFFAYIVAASIFMQPAIFDRWNFIVASSLLFFFTGMADDLIALRAMKKLSAQLVPTFIIVFLGDVRIESFHGIFGIYELPYLLSTALTVSLFLFFTNAFNLIDGINCLAGSMGVLYMGLLGTLLSLCGQPGAACLAFSIVGATLGFLKFNLTPARIFMGDTGSLLLGFTIIVLTVIFVQEYSATAPVAALVHTPEATYTIAVGILSFPLFDCFRVFFSRMRKGNPPFKADRTHMHHYLLDLGYSHLQSVAILLAGNIFMIGLAYLIQDMDAALAITILFLVACALFYVLRTVRKNYVARQAA